VREITLTGDADDWFRTVAGRRAPLVLADTGAVVMRKDPPFDPEYFYATHLLSQAEREGAGCSTSRRRCATTPRSWRSWSSRSSSAPTLVTRDAADVRAFHAEHRDIILKPLDGMGGMGIFRVGPDGLNLGSIIETLNRRRRADADGAEVPARDRAGRQARAGDRRQAGALLPGAHPAGQRDPRQPGRRRQGRGAAAERRRPPRSPRRWAPRWPRAGCCWWGWT
jgi:glutathione synthase